LLAAGHREPQFLQPERLPTFDNRIESTFLPNVHRALDEGRLDCIHPHGDETRPMEEVVGRFTMAVIPPRP
jgi:hypothetical protein